jgi:hypothetical protein
MRTSSFFGKSLSIKRVGWLFVLALAAGARAECLSTVESVGSRCSLETAGITWLNRPASPQPVRHDFFQLCSSLREISLRQSKRFRYCSKPHQWHVGQIDPRASRIH